MNLELPPIVQRELRLALSRRSFHFYRLVVAGLAIGLTLLHWLVSLAPSSRPGGGRLFENLMMAGYALAVIGTLHFSADLFARERRNNVLGLLFLTGVGAGQFYSCKIFSGACLAFSLLLSIVPVLAVPFLMGGVPASQFLAGVSSLPLLLLFTLALGTLGSVLAEDESAAMFIACGLGAFLCLSAPAAYGASKYLSDTGAISDAWLLLSPAYGPYLVMQSFTPASPGQFWQNSLVTLAYALGLLILSSRILARTWQDDWRVARGLGWRKRWQEWWRGSRSWRAAQRAHWLLKNPYVWLASRDRQLVHLAAASLILIGAVWMAGWWFWPRRWPSLLNFFFTATLVNVLLFWLMVYGAAKGIGQDRRQGTFELLLTTPLSVDQIVTGQVEAVLDQFKTIVAAAGFANLALMIGGLFLRRWDLPALTVYLLIWLSLVSSFWLLTRAAVGQAMWISLNSGRPLYAAFTTMPPVFVALWVGIVLLRASDYLSYFAGFPYGSPAELAIAGVIAGLILLAWRVAYQPEQSKKVEQLKRELRSIAREPLPEPSDPRFKTWDKNQRFPIPRRMEGLS